MAMLTESNTTIVLMQVVQKSTMAIREIFITDKKLKTISKEGINRLVNKITYEILTSWMFDSLIPADVDGTSAVRGFCNS